MVNTCRRGTLHTLAPVTAIEHDGRRVRAVVVRGERRVAVRHVISTLPLAAQLSLLQPAPGTAFLEAARRLEFRQVILVAVFLRRARAARYASTYFPDPRWPFTRVHEPAVRSAAMAPPGHTSLVAEVPCFAADEVWQRNDDALAGQVKDALIDASMIAREGNRRQRGAAPAQCLPNPAHRRRRASRTGTGGPGGTREPEPRRTSGDLPLPPTLHDLMRAAFAAVGALAGEREALPNGVP